MELQPLDGYDTPATSWPGSGFAVPTGAGSQWTPQRVQSKRTNIIELILQQVALAVQGFLVNGSGFSQLSYWATGIGLQLTEHTEAIASLADIAGVPATQAWVSDIDDMATIARASVTSTALTGNGSAPKYCDVLDHDSVSSSGTSEYRLHRRVCPTFKPEAATGSSLGDIYYVPIVADRKARTQNMRWIAGADTSIFSINYYEMALCVYNPSNGNIEKVWGSGNIKDAEADTTTLGEVAKAMSTIAAPDGDCSPGQILFAAHQQTAPGLFQSTRRVAAVPEPNIDRTVPLLDAWCYIAPNYTQGIPSSIAFEDLTRESRFVPWVSVSAIAIPEE